MHFKNGDQLITFLLFGWLWWSVDEVSPVRIKELRVPAVARHGSAVVLDCDYTLEAGGDEGLVVKWYLNDQSRPVYVWIPDGSAGPRGLGVLNGRLNLGYRASHDKRTEHRALHIPASTRDIAGDYTCVVSTFQGEDRQTKTMLVFVPEKNLRLRQGKTADGTPNVVCSAEGVYPEPEMIIRMTHENMSREMEDTLVQRREGDAGLFDISVMATLPEDIIDSPALENTVFTCELKVPRANNYTVRKEFVYYAGNANVNNSSILGVFVTVLLSILLYS